MLIPLIAKEASTIYSCCIVVLSILQINQLFVDELVNITLPPRDVLEILSIPNLLLPGKEILQEYSHKLAEQQSKFDGTLVYVEPTIVQKPLDLVFQFNFGLYYLNGLGAVNGTQCTYNQTIMIDFEKLNTINSPDEVSFLTPQKIDQWYPKKTFTPRAFRTITMRASLDCLALWLYVSLLLLQLMRPLYNKIILYACSSLFLLTLATKEICHLFLVLDAGAEIIHRGLIDLVWDLIFNFWLLLGHLWWSISRMRHVWRKEVAKLRKENVGRTGIASEQVFPYYG